MQIKSLVPQLDYLYMQETESYLMNPTQQMSTQLITECLNNYLQAVETTSKLLTSDRRKLSDEDFVYFLSRIATIELSEQNIIYILNKTYHQKYQKFTTILTTMTTKYINRGNIEEYIIGYNVLASENSIEEGRIYTKKEVEKFLNEHQILIYNVFEAEFMGTEFEHEAYEEYAMVDLYDFLNNKKEIRDNALKYIREHVTNKEIKDVMQKYLCHLQLITKKIMTQRDKFKFEQEFSSKCKKEFTKNGQLLKLNRLIANINK